jgi:polyisoprenoid-binding protein YceI
MTARELDTLLLSAQPPTLLHVLPSEVFAAARLAGSKNACIYETAFPEHVQKLALDPAAPLVVYGAGEGSLDAVTAGERLRALGFTRIEVFEGGLAEWQSAGLPIEGTGQLPQPVVPHGHYCVDTAQSVIRWTGRNLFNHHQGTVRLSGGDIEVSRGQLTGARFTIDLTSIVCEDLGDPAMNALLLAHLRTTDFFDTEQFPAAEFAATAAERIPSCTDGTSNHLLRGTFTLRGITHPLEFPVLIAAKDDARHLTGQGVLSFDRTAYGSHYGSGKLFRYLGSHVVNDHVHLHVKIHAEREVKVQR